MSWTSKEERHRHYLKHREEIIAKQQARNEANREQYNEYGRQYYHNHREECLAYAKAQAKRTIKHNGKVILRNVDKPPKPESCQLCQNKSMLIYHHWEDEKPEVGLWICNLCHAAVHRLINSGELEANAESQLKVRSALGI